MKNAINVTGHVLVADIVTAFEPLVDEDLLLKLDKAVQARRDDRINFDDVEVSISAAVDALDEADELPKPEDLSDQIDETTLIGLAEAIRCGETARAEEALDRVFAGLIEAATLREWIDRGRYSMKARKAGTIAAEPLRKVA